MEDDLSPMLVNDLDLTGAAPLRRLMPDVARDVRAPVSRRLDRVGMDHIEMPIWVDGDGGVRWRVPAVIAAFVNLDAPDAKGIHMSRMFLTVQRHVERGPITPDAIRAMLAELLDTHAGLSTSAVVRIRFDWVEKRSALVSDNKGWRTYPVELEGRLDARGFRFGAAVTVTYSSTCPCSAALARQLIQEQFERDFTDTTPITRDRVLTWLGSEQGIVATPHSQRSHAVVQVRFAEPAAAMGVSAIIDRAEGALRTAVQAAVKREDEQAFALLNGQNLMFCEDAARRLAAAFDVAEVSDYRITASHFESLHPHDAVSVVTKGVLGGFIA